jgi:glycosyltransferase involved in cell wall biosynthesis
MKVLFLAPLPPPIHGQSLASEVLLARLRERYEVDVVDLGRDSQQFGGVTRKRLTAVAEVLREIGRLGTNYDVCYFTIAESLAGNLKDIGIYLLCMRRLNRMCIHLHGGSIGDQLFDRRPLIRRINEYFLRKLGGVIVSGPSHRKIFATMAVAEHIHAIPNFAMESLFVSDQVMAEKWKRYAPLKLLFLSGMLPGKGFPTLTEAFFALTPEERAHIHIDYAGKFLSEQAKASFVARIEGEPNLRYHGMVTDEEKQRLFAEAHMFCLPSTYTEGQPISILEAYASGCAVLTTGQPGIRDVFADGVNGFEVEIGSVESIRDALRVAIRDHTALQRMASHNRSTASRDYTTGAYTASITRILETIARSASAEMTLDARALSRPSEARRSRRDS